MFVKSARAIRDTCCALEDEVEDDDDEAPPTASTGGEADAPLFEDEVGMGTDMY